MTIMWRCSRKILFAFAFFVCLYMDTGAQDDTSEIEEALNNIKDAFKNLYDSFVQKIKSANDLEATDVQDLKIKVNETLQFLETMKANKEDIEKTADAATIKALEYLDLWISEVKSTASQIEENGEAMVKQWKNQSASFYNSGLDRLIAYSQKTNSSPANSATFITLFALLLVSVILN